MDNVEVQVAKKTQIEIIKLTFAQTFSASISHVFSICLMAFWFSFVSPVDELLVWVGAIMFVSSVRICLYYAYARYATEQNAAAWMHAWSGLFFVMGLIYVIGFIYFTPLDRNEYLVSIGMFVVALGATAVIGYAASFYATLSFFIPITLPNIVFLMVYGGSSGKVAAFTIIIFSCIALVLLKNSNKAYKKSIFLNFKHQQEIEKRKLIEKQLQEISRQDSLTGLFNRRYFDEVLELEMGRAKRHNLPLCLIMFDIDFFKEYNDQYGHVNGDNCLIDIAKIAQNFVSRQGDIVARYGGEEFVIILPNIELEGAVVFANSLQLRIQEQSFPHASTKVLDTECVTISLGVANLVPSQHTKASDLIESADSALYEAKRRGRNCVYVDSDLKLSKTSN